MKDEEQGCLPIRRNPMCNEKIVFRTKYAGVSSLKGSEGYQGERILQEDNKPQRVYMSILILEKA